MQRVRVPINSFQFGEISPSTLMRTDSALYASSAQSLKNMMVIAEGGVKKRPALKHHYTYTGITPDGTDYESVLHPFVFDDNEEYIISIEDAQVRCFRILSDDSVSLVSTLTQDIDTNALPFDSAYSNQYTVAQYGDVMFICHPLFMPRMLVRTSLTTFEIETYSFDIRADGNVIYQPYTRFQAYGVTIDPSATTGSITVTSSADHFTSDHVGSVIRYGESEIEITAYTSATQVTGTVVDELKIRLAVLNPFRTRDGSTSVEVTHLNHGYTGGESITFEDASTTGGITTANLNGARTILEIIDENTYVFTAGAAATSSEDGGGYVSVVTHAPTDNWDEQAFSAARGYPAAVTFHENRLVFGGTIAEPDTIWMSAIGKYFNHDLGDANDAEAINLVAATGQVNEIRYLVSNRDLQVFTNSAELYIPAFLNQALTPTSAQIRKQTPYGCAFVQPSSIDGATVFIQGGGPIMREFIYSEAEDAYNSTSVSTISSHLLTDPIFQAIAHGAFGAAESYAAVVNTDGTMAIFASNRAEKRAAWFPWETAGKFRSVVTINDKMFVNVWTEANELMLCEFTGDYGVDRYVVGDLTSSTIVDVSAAYGTGDVLDVVVDDIVYAGQFTAYLDTTDKIDLSAFSAYSEAICGEKFDVEIITNPIDLNGSMGPVTGEIRGIYTAVLSLTNSYHFTINSRSFSAASGFPTKKEIRLLGYGRDPVITISQNDPLPLQVNGMIAEVVL